MRQTSLPRSGGGSEPPRLFRRGLAITLASTGGPNQRQLEPNDELGAVDPSPPSRRLDPKRVRFQVRATHDTRDIANLKITKTGELGVRWAHLLIVRPLRWAGL